MWQHSGDTGSNMIFLDKRGVTDPYAGYIRNGIQRTRFKHSDLYAVIAQVFGVLRLNGNCTYMNKDDKAGDKF